MFLRRLEEEMADFTKNSKQNFVEKLGMIQIGDQPLIGVARASDPLWEKLKEHEVVGQCHLTQNEWLHEVKSVIPYFLLFTENIRISNGLKGLLSREWLYGRYEGEIFNNALRCLIINMVESEGRKALTPALNKRFTVNNHVNNWPEPHATFITGLWTFTLSNSLITPLGTAGRLGSVIVGLKFEPKLRLYQGIDEYCIKCGVYIERCPHEAITRMVKTRNAISSTCIEYLS